MLTNQSDNLSSVKLPTNFEELGTVNLNETGILIFMSIYDSRYFLNQKHLSYDKEMKKHIHISVK
jgi:hypothetical protein